MPGLMGPSLSLISRRGGKTPRPGWDMSGHQFSVVPSDYGEQIRLTDGTLESPDTWTVTTAGDNQGGAWYRNAAGLYVHETQAGGWSGIVENNRWNFVTQSRDMTVAPWGGVLASAADSGDDLGGNASVPWWRVTTTHPSGHMTQAAIRPADRAAIAGKYVMSFYVREGTSSSFLVRLTDTTLGGVARINVVFDWVDGAPVVNGTPTGAVAIRRITEGYLIEIRTGTDVVPENDHTIYLYPGGAVGAGTPGEYTDVCEWQLEAGLNAASAYEAPDSSSRIPTDATEKLRSLVVWKDGIDRISLAVGTLFVAWRSFVNAEASDRYLILYDDRVTSGGFFDGRLLYWAQNNRNIGYAWARYNNPYTTIESTLDPVPYDWHTAAITWDGGDGALYVDGAFIGSDSGDVPSVHYTDYKLGSTSYVDGGQQQLSGQVGAGEHFDRVLSGAEITELHTYWISRLSTWTLPF